MRIEKVVVRQQRRSWVSFPYDSFLFSICIVSAMALCCAVQNLPFEQQCVYSVRYYLIYDHGDIGNLLYLSTARVRALFELDTSAKLRSRPAISGGLSRVSIF